MNTKTTSGFESPLLTKASSDSTISTSVPSLGSTNIDDWDELPLASQIHALLQLTKFVDKIIENDDCEPFRQPVDTEIYEDYLEFIDHPMDLGTVKDKLKKWQYLTAEDAAHDIALIWTNCMAYNEEEYAIWGTASKYDRAFRKHYKKVCKKRTYITFAYFRFWLLCVASSNHPCFKHHFQTT